MLRALRLFAILSCLFAYASAHAAIFQVRGTATESRIPVPGLSVAVAHAGGSTKLATTSSVDPVGFYRVVFSEAIANGDEFSVTVSESGTQIGTGSTTYTVTPPAPPPSFAVVNISVTTAMPTITTFASADGRAIVNADSISLVGTTSEPNRAVTVTRGADAFSATTDGSGAFQVTAPLLQNAENNFSATVADEFGKSVSASASITEDSTSPIISAPRDGEAFLSSSGTTLVFSGGDGFLNGSSVSSGVFVSGTGSHALRVRDAAGNETVVSFSIRKPVAPTISEFSVKISVASLLLQWDGDADFFQVFRNGRILTTVYSPGYTDSSVEPGKIQSYRILAYRDGLEVSAKATGFLPVSTPVSDIKVGTENTIPGGSVSVGAQGAPGVSGVITLVDQGGNALVSQQLSETSSGVYNGALSIPNNLSDGVYDVVVDIGGQKQTLSGGISVDTIPPLLVLVGVNPQIIERGEVYADIGATATDAIDGNVSDRVAIASAVNANISGDYLVTYSVTDNAGNTATATRTVRVRDTRSPEVTTSSVEPTEVRNGISFTAKVTTEAGATVTADVSAVDSTKTATVGLTEVTATPGAFTATVAISAVNVAASGDKVVKFTITDAAGNTASAEAKIRLQNETSYTLNLHAGVNLVHVPVKVKTLSRASDLFTLLGGGEFVSVVILADAAGKFQPYTAHVEIGSLSDLAISDGVGAIVVMKKATSVRVTGEMLGETVALSKGLNVVGVTRSGAVATANGIFGLAPDAISVVIAETGGKFKVVSAAADVSVSGGAAYLVNATAATTLVFKGGAWQNTAAAPSVFPIFYNGMTEEELWVFLHALEGQATPTVSAPPKSALLPNYPNPFNPETWIPFQIAEGTTVHITIYGPAGQIVRTLELGSLPAGTYTTRSKAAYWDGTNDAGERVASGPYFYRIEAGSYSAMRRMVILK